MYVWVKKQIFLLMKQAYAQAMPVYENALRDLCQTYMHSFAESENVTDEMLDQKAREARRAYLEEVSGLIYDALNMADPAIMARYRLARCRPELYMPDFSWDADLAVQMDQTLSAGAQYMQVYYAITGKVGKSKDAIAHNHMAHECMDSVINKVAQEMGAL